MNRIFIVKFLRFKRANTHKTMKAIIITIGDEILIGQTIDTNSAWMGQQFNMKGISVEEIVTIKDTEEAIRTAVHAALQKADLVVTTGGLGPTKDDLTKETLAAYFGKKLVTHPVILERIESYFKKRGRTLNEQGKKVALLPEDTRLFMNHKGTAPGMWFEKEGKIVVALPGVPYEMKRFIKEDILPALESHLQGQILVHKTIMVAGVGETAVAEAIEKIESSLPAYIKLAYLPNLSILRVRLSAIGTDEEKLRKEVQKWTDQIVDTIPNWVYGFDELRLEKAVGNLLLEKKARMAIAESCTGGQIASQVVSIPGSSEYFEGGVVAYSYELKTALLGVKPETLASKGAVSKETVEEMARGAIENLHVDYSIATSGIAGPGGATADKPVGTIWMAIASKDATKSKKFQLTDHRDLNIKMTANLALNELRKFILKENAAAEA